ncbi:MAG TPA: hypothetical protein VK838_05805 [Candidatus Limnocylindrales bacterium]|nr:hypothetical protein [Candidatus Limnocylindrales bacterium]
MRLVHGRLAAISVRASFGAGMWVGAALGLVIGSGLGAVLVWFTGSVLEWQRELGFTLGIARTLLPFGDQIGALRWISSSWWLVIPGVALATALLAGVVGGLIGALLAAAYNRSPRHAAVVVEMPDEAGETVGPSPGADR